MPLGGELVDQPVDRRAWRRRRRRASARRRSGPSAAGSSHLANSTFCWLPPDSVATGASCAARARRGGSTSVARSGAPRCAASTTPAVADVARRCDERDVLARSERQHQQPLRPCGSRAPSRCRGAIASRGLRGAQTGSPSTRSRRRRAGRRRRSARATSVRPLPTSPASPTISPARTVEARRLRRRRPRRARAPRARPGRRRRGGACRGTSRLDRRGRASRSTSVCRRLVRGRRRCGRRARPASPSPCRRRASTSSR